MKDKKEKLNLKTFLIIFCFSLLYVFLLSSFPIKNKVCCMFGVSRYHGPLFGVSNSVETYEEAQYVYKYSTPKLISLGYDFAVNWVLVVIDVFLALALSSLIQKIITNKIYKKKNFWIYAVIVGITITIVLHLIFRSILLNSGSYIAG
ncbi:MAG TPA: hypothetical protein VJY47_03585 [Candidatus Dojkabacteria bacterium]|nr:hypothetical protein [Candidatus Dojkabacteria bacterium]